MTEHLAQIFFLGDWIFFQSDTQVSCCDGLWERGRVLSMRESGETEETDSANGNV